MKKPVSEHLPPGGLPALAGLILSTLLLASCASNDNLPPPSAADASALASRSGVVSDIIDAETAEYAAAKVMNAPVNGVEVTHPKLVSGSLPITNSEGATVMYAVNFESDGGFVILSASKKAIPIVASSERGNYDPSMLTSMFVSRLINQASRHITESLHYPEDSLTAYTEHWAALLPPTIEVPIRILSSNENSYQEFIDKAVSLWYADGCEVYDAKKWQNNEYGSCKYLPGLDQLLESLSMQVSWADGKPMNELSFIVVRHTYTYTKNEVGCDPVTTNWKTTAPYNSAVPNGMPLSSEAVAVGQILHYFKDPVINNFSASASNPLQNNTEIANFLYDVAKKVHTVFGSSYSYASYINVQTALSQTYHYTYQTGPFNEGELIYSINNGSPSIIIEYDIDGKSHAWICDGYRLVSDRISYYLMTPAGQPEDYFYGYECAGEWDENGVSNFQFANQTDNIYFSPFFTNIDSLYMQPEHFYFFFKK
ncbi:MAG: C10 family peptidase [Paramuribaculum sp.]|nr:C10 family peptidase [Paramuribaculum sp.]